MFVMVFKSLGINENFRNVLKEQKSILKTQQSKNCTLGGSPSFGDQWEEYIHWGKHLPLSGCKAKFWWWKDMKHHLLGLWGREVGFIPLRVPEPSTVQYCSYTGLRLAQKLNGGIMQSLVLNGDSNYSNSLHKISYLKKMQFIAPWDRHRGH